MNDRPYDPAFATCSGSKTCPACDRAAPSKCGFHLWVDRMRKRWPMKHLTEEDLNGPLDRAAYEATLPKALAMLHCSCAEGDDNAPDHAADCNLVRYPARGTLPTGGNDHG